MNVNEYCHLHRGQKIENRSHKSDMENLKNLSEIARIKRRGNFVLRQELKDYTPECNIKFSLLFNSAMLLVFIGCGVPILNSSSTTLIQEIPYEKCSTKSVYDKTSNKNVTRCTLKFNLTDTFPKPVYFYYKLEGYYINHRQYVSSKIWAQLRGDNSSAYISRCSGLQYNFEAFGNQTSKMKSYAGMPLRPEAELSPCGKIAFNYFNDSYKLFSNEGEKQSQIYINETGIAHSADRITTFKRNANSSWTQWTDVENEHFMVWMNMETFPTFYKKWGHSNQDLTKSVYTLEIDYNWDVETNGVLKSFVISSAQQLGSESFIGYAFLVAAVVCFISLMVLIFTSSCQKKHFHEKDLTWK